jgi:hypothetical protein
MGNFTKNAPIPIIYKVLLISKVNTPLKVIIEAFMYELRKYRIKISRGKDANKV